MGGDIPGPYRRRPFLLEQFADRNHNLARTEEAVDHRQRHGRALVGFPCLFTDRVNHPTIGNPLGVVDLALRKQLGLTLRRAEDLDAEQRRIYRNPVFEPGSGCQKDHIWNAHLVPLAKG